VASDPIHSGKDNESKTCPQAMLSATSECDIKGQMIFYQDVKGNTWLTGTYQYGFQDPNIWNYDWTIQNGCGEILFNLTSWLNMEFVKDSGCNGYSSDDSKKNDYKKRGGYLNKRHKFGTFDEKCYIGPWGTKPWVIKVDKLTWDCEKEGIKYHTCDEKDIYDDKVADHDDEIPNRLDDQGPKTGLYLIINGESKSGKRDNSQSVAEININDY
ncbi:6652_t:CDS:1, partial [Dentiscutata heterogama]